MDSERRIESGGLFAAKNTFGEVTIYLFKGINIDDATGCTYIVLQSMYDNEEACVEHAWFRERRIKLLPEHTRINNGRLAGKLKYNRDKYTANLYNRADVYVDSVKTAKGWQPLGGHLETWAWKDIRIDW